MVVDKPIYDETDEVFVDAEEYPLGFYSFEEEVFISADQRNAIKILGGCCVRCGTKRLPQLELDHIFNDGKNDRGTNSAKTVIKMYKEGLDPKTKFQVLCRGCNWLKFRINRDREKVGMPLLTSYSLTSIA